MSTTMQPPAAAPKPSNRLGYTLADYKGADSTLCAGCGQGLRGGSGVRANTNAAGGIF